ncbi:2OG-Fe(II) oxygenase [Aliikangiella coralliicola]|uniref:2OG-Fe(II) oxygenase n=1 Tax=Aliikangiella coralliicola TaxID=2592383 RepID=A0A545UG25_9GAMM|nr:2OG-Fe(II) oxygenase [Aliikangiella coralliicola]TQV88418.1 2OG-Fe(II) oxygenase [Aliikangiella coralliicola]
MQNFIVEFKQAFSPEYCQQLIKKFKKSPHKTDGRTGAGVDKSKKDSLDLYISNLPEWEEDCNIIGQTILKATVQYAKMYPFILTGAISPSILDPETKELRTIQYDDLAKLDEPQLENLVRTIYRLDEVNLQRYTKGRGGYHHWHSEHYPHPTDNQQRSLHRVLLWLIYLNDVEDGGETEFFYQQAQVKPTQGSLILAPCGFTHTHRGSIPKSNDKYVLASWVLYQDARQLYAAPKT